MSALSTTTGHDFWQRWAESQADFTHCISRPPDLGPACPSTRCVAVGRWFATRSVYVCKDAITPSAHDPSSLWRVLVRGNLASIGSHGQDPGPRQSQPSDGSGQPSSPAAPRPSPTEAAPTSRRRHTRWCSAGRKMKRRRIYLTAQKAELARTRKADWTFHASSCSVWAAKQDLTVWCGAQSFARQASSHRGRRGRTRIK